MAAAAGARGALMTSPGVPAGAQCCQLRRFPGQGGGCWKKAPKWGCSRVGAGQSPDLIPTLNPGHMNLYFSFPSPSWSPLYSFLFRVNELAVKEPLHSSLISGKHGLAAGSQLSRVSLAFHPLSPGILIGEALRPALLLCRLEGHTSVWRCPGAALAGLA